MKKIFFLFLLLSFLVSCSSSENKKVKKADLSFLNVEKETKIPEENIVLLKTDFGDIVIKLYPNKSPKSVKLFKKLCANGFYIGTSFHRVIPDVLIQGGDPLSKDGNLYNDGTGSYEEKVPLEQNDLKMKRGAVAISHPAGYTEGSSQFFICLRNIPSWNNKYTIIGYVISGLNVVKKISHLKRGSGRLREHPLVKVKILKIKFLKKWKRNK